MYKHAAQKGGTPEVFADLHEQFVNLLGFDDGDQAFTAILGHFGKTDIRQFKSMTEVRNCIKEMHEAIGSVRSAQPEEESFVLEPEVVA
jgi:ribosomal 50S subunit-associated protein YjgA (DUF615 family)